MNLESGQILVGVGAIIIEGNKILLTRRKGAHASGTYGSVGGHLEYGESPTQALEREAMEELGIELKNINFLVCTNLIKYDRHVININFLAEIKSGEPRIMEPDRIELLEWFDLEDLPSPLFEPLKIGIQAYKEGRNYFEVK